MKHHYCELPLFNNKVSPWKEGVKDEWKGIGVRNTENKRSHRKRVTCEEQGSIINVCLCATGKGNSPALKLALRSSYLNYLHANKDRKKQWRKTRHISRIYLDNKKS